MARRHRPLRALGVWLALAAPAVAFAQDAISPETLAAVKDATVFLKLVEQGGESSGSGFIVKSDARDIFIVTNHHVVADRRNRTDAPITAVLHSGTNREKSFRGQVTAVDPEMDLAVVRIPGFENSPKPLDVTHSVEAVETMPLYAFGFPLGRLLDPQFKNPAITVSRNSVTSLRRSADGKLDRLQVDGSINPGNSGGPVVDAKGRLMGVVVTLAAGANQISQAIPRERVLDVLAGYAGAIVLKQDGAQRGTTTYEAELILVDPFGRIQSASLLAAPLTAANKDGFKAGEALPGAKPQTLAVAARKAKGRVTINLPAGASDRRVWLQVDTTDAQGATTHSKPVTLTLAANRVVGVYDLRTGKGVALTQDTPKTVARRPGAAPDAPEERKGLVAPFFTAVFSAKRKLALTLDRDGVVRVYDANTFAIKGAAKLAGPAAHAALDSDNGLLYAYVAVEGYLRYNSNNDRAPHGLADLHVYDVKTLLDSKEEPDEEPDLVPIATFPRNANAAGMANTALGKFIYALERTREDENGGPAKLVRISVADRKPELELDVAEGIESFCLTPDGRTIYAVGRVQGRGLLLAVDASSLELRRTLAIEGEPTDVEATSSGFVLIATQGGRVLVAEMAKSRAVIGSWYGGGYQPSIRLAADQKRVYTGEYKNFLGRTITSWLLTAQSQSQMATRTGGLSAVGQDAPSLAGELFLTPDNQAILTRSGAVIPLGSKKFAPATKPKKIDEPVGKGKPKAIR